MLPEKKEAVTNGASGDHEEESPQRPQQSSFTEDQEHDPQFVPIVYLPEVHIPTLEEHEDELVKLKAKLFRFDNTCEPPEWKERGTGEIKLLQHRERQSVRVLMRRDKTLKICANHLVASWMQLKPNCGSDRAWVWSVNADYADEEPKSELLAARFVNSEEAKKFYDAFELAKQLVQKTTKPDEFRDAEETSEESDDASEDEEQDEAVEGDKPEPNKQDSELADQLSKVKVEEGLKTDV